MDVFSYACHLPHPAAMATHLLQTPLHGLAKRLSRANPFNKTDAGNGSNGICRVIDVSRSPSPDPSR